MEITSDDVKNDMLPTIPSNKKGVPQMLIADTAIFKYYSQVLPQEDFA